MKAVLRDEAWEHPARRQRAERAGVPAVAKPADVSREAQLLEQPGRQLRAALPAAALAAVAPLRVAEARLL